MRFDRRRFLALTATTATVTAGGVFVSRVDDPAGAATVPAGSRPAGLTTTGDTSPVGVDPDDVRFAWRLVDGRRGARQSAYRLIVSSVPPGGGGGSVVWDSGTVRSGAQAFVPYGGPVLSPATPYRWTVRVAEGATARLGPPSPAATFVTGLRTGDWRASWLRPGPADPGEEAYTYLRSDWSLPAGRVAWATAFVAAAHRYQLFVNGTQVSAGPSFCFPDEQYVQATDVTDSLSAGGQNAIGVLHHWYGPGRGRPTSAPGLLVQVVVRFTDGRTALLGTDGTWRQHPAEWLPAPQRNNDSGDFVEWVDARRHPDGWARHGFGDGAWTTATVLGPVGTAPFTALYAQRTRITERRVAPVSVRTLPSGSVVADFGRVYAGRPTVAFDRGTAGHTVPMHVGYLLDPGGAVSTTHGTQGTDLSFSLVQRDGPWTVDPYWYLGFRYLQVDQPGESLGAARFGLTARHASMPDVAPATFSSSSPTLDAVWQLCAHSALYTSQEQFIDTPTREKGQFLWDAANESETVMRAFGEQNLSWQGLRDMARAQARYWPTGQLNEVYPNDDGAQDYPTFTARYPEWVWRYYLSTGDRETVVGLLSVLQRLSVYLRSAVDPSTGLLSGLTLSNNGDDQYGYDYDTAADTTMNVLAVNAHQRIAQVAALAADGGTAAAEMQAAAVLSGRINQLLIGPNGVYVDGLHADGTLSPHASQLANASALAYGVAATAGPAVSTTVGRYVASLDISVEPDHGLELLRGLHLAGRDDDVVRLLTDRSFPGWAAILAAGGTFTWETWRPSDLIGDSMSHGWGSSALVAVQEALLGAVPRPPSAGQPPTVVGVSPPPRLTRLQWASGTFPSPAGTYRLSWRWTRSGQAVSLTVPPNAAAVCTFPRASLDRVTEGGVPLSRSSGVVVSSPPPGPGVTASVPAGTYELFVRS
jgi:alpha-L-rhamnosidase